MSASDPGFGPPLSREEEALREHLAVVLSRQLPLTQGPYALSLALIPEGERTMRGGQRGPVLYDSQYLSALLHFDGLDRRGAPFGMDQALRICPRAEKDYARIAAIVEALARVTRRLIRDVQDDRFGERPWLGLVHLNDALWAVERTPAKRTRTADQYEAIMLSARGLRELLVPPAAELDQAVAELDDWLAGHATLAKTKTIELATVPDPSGSSESRPSPHGVEVSRAGLSATFRLTTFEPKGSIRDIKEQRLLVCPARLLADVTRVLAFLDGLVATLPHAFTRWGDRVETMMPHDLVDLAVLDLKRPSTAEDFTQALSRRWKLASAKRR